MATAYTTGTVTYASTGLPAAGATIYAIDTDTDEVAGIGTTDSDGIYLISALDNANRYHATVERLVDGTTWYSAKAQPNATLVTYTPTVTSVIVAPDTFDGEAEDTIQLTATSYDQYGNVIADTYTWLSDDTDVATVDGDGLVTAVAEGFVTITATSVTDTDVSGTSDGTIGDPVGYDTPDFDAMTGEGIMGLTGVPIAFDAARLWEDDTEWRTQMANYGNPVGSGENMAPYDNGALAGTAPDNATARYQGEKFPDLALWQDVVQYRGTPAFELSILGTNEGFSAPTPQLFLALPTATYSIWLFGRIQMPAGFTAVGDADSIDGIAFNLTQSAGWKWPMHAGWNDGRYSVEIGNATNYALVAGRSGAPSIAESAAGADITTEFTDEQWIDYAAHFEQLIGQNGNTYVGVCFWTRAEGDAAYERKSVRRTADTETPTPAPIINAGAFPKNYNQSRKTQEDYWLWGHAAFDDTDVPDPAGILAQEAGFVPGDASVSTADNITDDSADFDVTIGFYSRYIVPVIDDVEDMGQSFEIPAETPDVLPISNGTGSIPPMVLTQTVVMDPGEHTVAFNVYNADQTESVATNERSVTIPGGPFDPYDLTINFRSTSGFVTDGTDQTYCLAEAYPTTRAGTTFGFQSSELSGFGFADRDAGLDPRLAGLVVKSTTPQGYFQWDLPGAGTYDIYAAACDPTFGIGQQNFGLYDVTAEEDRYALTNDTEIAVTEYEDIDGDPQTIAGFPGNWTAVASITMEGTALRIFMGDNVTTNSCVLSSIRIIRTG